jgi:hypothetical protein
VPGTAAAMPLTALWPAQCRCGGSFSGSRPCAAAQVDLGAPSRGSARQAAAGRHDAGRARLAAVASRWSGGGVAPAEGLCAAAGAARASRCPSCARIQNLDLRMATLPLLICRKNQRPNAGGTEKDV